MHKNTVKPIKQSNDKVLLQQFFQQNRKENKARNTNSFILVRPNGSSYFQFLPFIDLDTMCIQLLITAAQSLNDQNTMIMNKYKKILSGKLLPLKTLENKKSDSCSDFNLLSYDSVWINLTNSSYSVLQRVLTIGLNREQKTNLTRDY